MKKQIETRSEIPCGASMFCALCVSFASLFFAAWGSGVLRSSAGRAPSRVIPFDSETDHIQNIDCLTSPCFSQFTLCLSLLQSLTITHNTPFSFSWTSGRDFTPQPRPPHVQDACRNPKFKFSLLSLSISKMTHYYVYKIRVPTIPCVCYDALTFIRKSSPSSPLLFRHSSEYVSYLMYYCVSVCDKSPLLPANHTSQEKNSLSQIRTSAPLPPPS